MRRCATSQHRDWSKSKGRVRVAKDEKGVMVEDEE